MKINSNIIKIFIVSFFLGTTTTQAYTWVVDMCQPFGCKGCGYGTNNDVRKKVEDAAEDIDDWFEDLEEHIADVYKKQILKPNLKKIKIIQMGITKSVARIRAMEHEANIDSKHLIFVLRKNKELYTLPVVGAHK